MSDNYAVAVGSTLPTLCEEVNELLAIGYVPAGNLVVLPRTDEHGDYSMLYQPMIKHALATDSNFKEQG